MATAISIAAMALPAGAPGAEVVIPLPVKPQTVTPHVANGPSTVPAPAPNPAPSPAPAPPPPPPSRGGGGGTLEEGDVPGFNVPSQSAFPEDLPDPWDSDCLMDCKQEWFQWFDDRHRAVFIESLTGGASKFAVKLLDDQVRGLERDIEQMGGTPGERGPDPAEARQSAGAQSAGSGAVRKPVSSAAKSDEPPAEDPMYGWALGEGEWTFPITVVEAIEGITDFFGFSSPAAMCAQPKVDGSGNTYCAK